MAYCDLVPAQRPTVPLHLAVRRGTGSAALRNFVDLVRRAAKEAAPDSTGLRLCGPGERLVEKHGTKTRRGWRKLHLATDADTGRIVASALTDKDAGDGSRVAALLGRVEGPVASFIGDVAARHPEAAVVVPPRASAVLSDAAETAPTRRDAPLRCVAERGRM